MGIEIAFISNLQSLISLYLKGELECDDLEGCDFDIHAAIGPGQWLIVLFQQVALRSSSYWQAAADAHCPALAMRLIHAHDQGVGVLGSLDRVDDYIS